MLPAGGVEVDVLDALRVGGRRGVGDEQPVADPDREPGQRAEEAVDQIGDDAGDPARVAAEDEGRAGRRLPAVRVRGWDARRRSAVGVGVAVRRRLAVGAGLLLGVGIGGRCACVPP